MTGAEWKRRLTVWGGAIAISAASFGLILWFAAWLPAVLFTGWMHLSPRARSIAMPVCFFVVACAPVMIVFSQGLRRRRAQRWNPARPRRAH